MAGGSSASASAWIVGLILIVASAITIRHAYAVSCPQAIAMLQPCQAYLVGQSSQLTVSCCDGASALNGMVHDKSDLRNLCVCLKQVAAALHVIDARAKSLPQDCHINVPVPIDPNIDCSRI